MRQQLWITGLALTLGVGAAASSHAAIVTDTFDRVVDPGWGSVDNGVVQGDSGAQAASYTLDAAGTVNGATGLFANSRVLLDYNLAADPDVIAAGGFIVDVQVNPADGDDTLGESGTGREFAGIAFTDSNQNPPYGGSGAITNSSNDTIRFGLLPRNSGSVGNIVRTAGNAYNLNAGGNPNSGFNEFVFDQATFDDYVNQGVPDPFVNSKFYDVRIIVSSDFTAAASSTARAFVDGVEVDFDLNDADVDPLTFEWGDAGQAYLSFIAFNGPHQYDNLRVGALPEPTSATLCVLAASALGVFRDRRTRRSGVVSRKNGSRRDDVVGVCSL